MRPRNFFDIETGPWSGAKPFDWSTVKLGNIKDPEKIKAKRAEAAKEYEDKLALSPMTGEILAIGVCDSRDGYKVLKSNEVIILCDFLEWLNDALYAQEAVIGWNITNFDLQFICKRACLHGLGDKIPAVLLDRGKYWHSCIKDLMTIWAFGEWNCFTKLDVCAEFLGFKGEEQVITGKQFAKYYQGTPEQRKVALDYLKDDVDKLQYIADRILF